MNILGLVVALIVSIHCCAAATNRSSVWLLANSQIFTTNSQSSQACIITGATGTTTLAGPITLLTTSNLVITGKFAVIGKGLGSAAFIDTSVGSNSILYSVSIQFIYNSTYSITLALPTQTINTATPTALTSTTLFGGIGTSYWTSTVSSSTTNSFPVVTGGNAVLTPTGSTWLSVQNIAGVYTATVDATTTPVTSATSGIVITDYVSSSTIAISQWNDNSAPAATADGTYNAFYQLGVRTKTSTISSTSSTLLNAASCTTTGRKRSVEHLIRDKRATPSSCSGVASIDPSMSSTVLSTACSNALAVGTGTAGVGTTVSDIAGAFLKGVTTVNALYETDYAIFGTGSSKYVIAANFGMLIALSSIIFSFLN